MNTEFRKEPRRIITAVLYFALTAFSLLGFTAMLIGQDQKLISAVKNCSIPSALFALLISAVTAFIGYTVLINDKSKFVLGYGAFTLYKIIEIIYLIGTDGYSKFLVLFVDILVLITVGFIFGTLFEANRLQIRYTPPKFRYAVIALYAVFRALKPFLDYKLAAVNLNPLQIAIIAVNITLCTVAFFFTVKLIVKPIIPNEKQI